MTKHRLLGVGVGLVLLALVIITLTPQNELLQRNQFEDLSGKSISVGNEHCSMSCQDNPDKRNYKKFIWAQPNNKDRMVSYNIREGDSFPVRAVDTKYEIIAVYRLDGMEFNDIEGLQKASPFEYTDNYLKLSLLYARIKERGGRNTPEVIYPFKCGNSKDVLVPIAGRSDTPLILNEELLREIEHQTNMFKFGEVKIYPFEDSGIGSDPSLFGFHYRPYARAAIMTIGVDPYFGNPENLKETRLLVDVDGDGDLGGDGSGSWSFTRLGICTDESFSVVTDQKIGYHGY